MNATKSPPSLAEVQKALAEALNQPPEVFQPGFKLLDCGREIERVEQMLGVTFSRINYVKATVAQLMAGLQGQEQIPL